MSFRLKTILGIALIEALLLALLVWSSLQYLGDLSGRELDKRAETTATLFATTVKDGVLSYDLAFLESYTAGMIENPGIVYARVRNENVLLAESGRADLLARPFAEDESYATVDDRVFDIRQEVAEGGTIYGYVELGISTEDNDATISSARRRIGSLALLEIFLVGVFSLVLGTYLTRQLRGLINASNAIAKGGPGHQIEVRGNDELADTARAFNTMSTRLADSYQQLENSYQHMTDNVADAIVTFDESREIVGVNRSMQALTGLSETELVGKPLSAILDAEKLVLEPGEMFETACHSIDGSPIALEASVSRIDLGDKQVRHALIARDIRERKQAEQQIQQYIGQLSASNRELEEFAYIASHDLREPLRKIRAFADIVQTDYTAQMDDEGRHYVNRMSNAAERMQQLIDDLLAFSRVKTRQDPFASVDLNVQMKHVLSDLEVLIEESGASVTVGDLPMIHGDSTLMRQLLQNLVANAIKFRDPQREPAVSVSCDREAADDGFWTIRVKDNGVGFDPRYNEKIFGLFERLQGRSQADGTGMGLAICRRIVERHGGSIRANGTPDVGAEFVVQMPRHKDVETT